jgi:hypothetical protein
MTELETALKSHDWSLAGYTTRPELDRLVRLHAESAVLWEQYCPWSATNGGYIAWAKK